MRVLGLICAAVLAVGATAGLAAAGSGDAPDYVSSEPAHEAKLDESPSEVVIQFSEPIDAESTMVVRDECGERIDDKNIVIFGNEMRVGIAVPREGVHRATFHAVGLGGVTGTRSGTVSYTVRNGKALACTPVGGHEGHGNGTGGGRHGAMEHPSGGDHTGASADHGDGHDTTAGGHDRHQGRGNHAGMAHGKRKHPGEHGKERDHGSGHDALTQALEESAARKAAAEPTALAAGDGPPGAGGSAVLAALGGAMLLGALGGWILRETAPVR
ncbi:MAG TPA: copper resistance protein CopC [Actinomycetota bacterium]|jgi:methionine-rich copper-binding protein CopC|nr:copper resistance protein CopC [Actinomycetota bacterium]